MNKSDTVFLKTCIFLVLEYNDLNEDDKLALINLSNKSSEKIKSIDKPRLIDLIRTLSKHIIKSLKMDNYFTDLESWSFFKIG